MQKLANQLTSSEIVALNTLKPDLFNYYYLQLKAENKLHLDFYDAEMERLNNNGKDYQRVLQLKIKFMETLKLEAYKRVGQANENRKYKN